MPASTHLDVVTNGRFWKAFNDGSEPRLYDAASDTSDSLGDDMIKRSAKAEVFQGVVFCLT